MGRLRALNLRVCRELSLDDCFHKLFARKCSYSFLDYCISEGHDDELDFEKEWASARPGARERFKEPDPFNDEPGSWESCLTKQERTRMMAYLADDDGRIYDLGQAEARRISSSYDGPLHTLMHGMGIIWVGKLRPPRWLAVRETGLAMGYTIDPKVAEETGTQNIFTRGHQGAYNRSRHSMACQIGNAMHVNACGGVFFTTAIMNPRAPHIAQGSFIGENGQEQTTESTNCNLKRNPPISLSTLTDDPDHRQIMRMLRKRNSET